MTGSARNNVGDAGHTLRSARGTIFLETGRVLSQLKYDAEQFVLRLTAPKCAAHFGAARRSTYCSAS